MSPFTSREKALLDLAARRIYALACQAERAERALRAQTAVIERLQASVDALVRENRALRVERECLRLALERPEAPEPAGRVALPRAFPIQAVPAAFRGGRWAPQRAA